MESLFYVLAYLYLGGLPWERKGMKMQADEIRREKKSIIPIIYWKDHLPMELIKISVIIWEMGFDERPNYKQII